ncbi:MAG TPA: PIN domain-containing protein [Solirubrobacteraceae bacterium]|nr:PIN domain-containing protein [Solirubrobacteraceae bacterium]
MDTDAFSFLHQEKGRHEEFRSLVAGRLVVLPFPVVGELRVGAIRGKLGARRVAALEAAIARCVEVSADARVVREWAPLRARLFNQLAGEGINDLWIAATCLAHRLPLVTSNLRDFGTIQRVEPRLVLVHPDL